MFSLPFCSAGFQIWVCIDPSACCFSPIVPSAPILQLEPLNCTSIVARWQISPESVAVLGYRLCYHEEGQPEQPTIQLQAQNYTYTISGLGEWCHSCLAMRRWDSGADKKTYIEHHVYLTMLLRSYHLNLILVWSQPRVTDGFLGIWVIPIQFGGQLDGAFAFSPSVLINMGWPLLPNQQPSTAWPPVLCEIRLPGLEVRVQMSLPPQFPILQLA